MFNNCLVLKLASESNTLSLSLSYMCEFNTRAQSNYALSPLMNRNYRSFPIVKCFTFADSPCSYRIAKMAQGWQVFAPCVALKASRICCNP